MSCSSNCRKLGLYKLLTKIVSGGVSRINSTFFQIHDLLLREGKKLPNKLKHTASAISLLEHMLYCITIHMPQRTNKILLVRLKANENAFLFQIYVTSFARYTM